MIWYTAVRPQEQWISHLAEISTFDTSVAHVKSILEGERSFRFYFLSSCALHLYKDCTVNKQNSAGGA